MAVTSKGEVVVMGFNGAQCWGLMFNALTGVSDMVFDISLHARPIKAFSSEV